MAVQGAQITLTTDAAPVLLAGSAIGVLRVRLYNRGTGAAYLGSSGVTSSGYRLSTADANPLSVTLQGSEYLYGCSTGTAPVIDVLRAGDTT